MKDSDMNGDNIESGKPTNINELLEPLVEENKSKTPRKNNNLYQSVKMNRNDYEPPTQKN